MKMSGCNSTIDKVRIYNRSLSASEVAGLYAQKMQAFFGTKKSFAFLVQEIPLGFLCILKSCAFYDNGTRSTHFKLLSIVG